MAGCMEIVVGPHCAKRFVERVHPELTLDEATQHLDLLLDGARLRPDLPWLNVPNAWA